jgi:hypothetical protein
MRFKLQVYLFIDMDNDIYFNNTIWGSNYKYILKQVGQLSVQYNDKLIEEDSRCWTTISNIFISLRCLKMASMWQTKQLLLIAKGDCGNGKRLLVNNQLEGDISIIRNTIMFIEWPCILSKLSINDKRDSLTFIEVKEHVYTPCGYPTWL